MKLVTAMAAVGGLTGVSRIAGFARDMLTASILGAGPAADAFFVALKLPNLFRRITAEGAFTVSFLPLYAKTLEQEGEEAGWKLVLNAFSFMLFGLGAFTVLILLIMPWFIYLVAPGFTAGELRYELAVDMTRITFPYLLLMSLTALLGAVMNSHHRFGPFAIAPVIFNLTLIVALLLSRKAEMAGYGMACGVLAAGFLQFFWLHYNARKVGFRLKIMKPVLDPKIKQIFKLMGPGIIGAGVMQINLFADIMIGSLLKQGSISYLYYADRLNQLPLGMVGIAVGTALLPMLSRALAAGRNEEATWLYNRAMEYCLLLALPAATALMVMPGPLIKVLFERGAFGPEDSLATMQVLMGYALGLPAYIAIKVFSTAHWARGDTKTPVKIAIVGALFNIVAGLSFIQFMDVGGIALATGLSGLLQFVLHIRALKGHEVARFDERFKSTAGKIIASSAAMAVAICLALYSMGRAFEFWIYENSLHGTIGLLVLIFGSGIVYGGLILMTGAVKVQDIKRYMVKK